MQKTTTSKKTDFINIDDELANGDKMEPSVKTLNNIMQFAASYRVQKLSKNQYAGMIIN